MISKFQWNLFSKLSTMESSNLSRIPRDLDSTFRHFFLPASSIKPSWESKFSKYFFSSKLRILSDYQRDALAANEKHRKDNNLKKCYWYDHFFVEGLVLYLLDKDGNLINRDSMYKIKPQVRIY